MDTPTLLLTGILLLAALAVVLLIVLLLRRPERALESALREEQREGRGELRGQLADSIQRTDARLDELRAALTDDAHKSRSELALRRTECVLFGHGEIALGAPFSDFTAVTVSFAVHDGGVTLQRQR